MEELVFIAALAPILAVGVSLLRRVGPSWAGAFWCLGWACMWLTGLVGSGTEIDDPLWALVPVFGSGFAAFMAAGACAFLGLDRRWAYAALGAGAVLAGTGAGLRLQGFDGAAFAASRANALLLIATAAILWRRGPGAVPSQRTLALLFAAMGGLHAAAWLLPALGIDRLSELAVWAGLCLGVALAQIFCFLDRSRLSEAQAIRALAAERRTLHSLFETIPAGLLLVAPDGSISVHNRQAAEFAGYPPDADLVGSDIEAYGEFAAAQLPGADRAAGLSVVREMGWMPSQRPEIEFRLEGPPERWITLTVREVESPAGDTLGRLWVFFDRTGAKQLDDRLARASRMEALSKAIGGIAHDVNNQLTTILGNTSLLMNTFEKDEETLLPLRDIEQAVRHSAEITRGLLDFSRQRTGPLRPLSVQRELQKLRVLEARLPAGIRLEIDCADGLPSLSADASQLKRVLENLVTNAIQAVGAHGEIRVDAAEGPDSTVRICVRDDGIGMNAETANHAFDPFFTTKGTGGTGLGLAIVHGIVAAHGAKIEIESTPGSGTCVTLLWPSSTEAPTPEPGRYSRTADLEGGGRVVLLTEDNDAVRALGRRALNQCGFQVVEAPDGETAIELASSKELRVDAAVLDFDLPGRNGIETLRELRRLRPGLPAMLASGRLGDEDKDGIPPDVSVLLKPYRPATLVEAVKSVLGNSER